MANPEDRVYAAPAIKTADAMTHTERMAMLDGFAADFRAKHHTAITHMRLAQGLVRVFGRAELKAWAARNNCRLEDRETGMPL